jgi:hypothetical protein
MKGRHETNGDKEGFFVCCVRGRHLQMATTNCDLEENVRGRHLQMATTNCDLEEKLRSPLGRHLTNGDRKWRPLMFVHKTTSF